MNVHSNLRRRIPFDVLKEQRRRLVAQFGSSASGGSNIWLGQNGLTDFEQLPILLEDIKKFA
jgi:hypothetical protein